MNDKRGFGRPLFDYSPPPPLLRQVPRIKPNLFAVLARFAFRNALAVIVFWAALVVALGAIATLKISPEQQALPAFKSSSQAQANLELLNKSFPNLAALTTITLRNDKPAELNAARADFLAELATRHDVFEMVFTPGTGSYYETHAILYHSQEELSARVAYALSLRPLFSAISEAPSADSLATLVGEVSAAIKQGRDPQGLDELFLQSAQSVQALMQGAVHKVDWIKIAGLELDPQPNTAIILVLPKLGANEKAAAFIQSALAKIAKAGTQVNAQANPPNFTAESKLDSDIKHAWPNIAEGLLGIFFGLLLLLGRLNLIVTLLAPVCVVETALAVMLALVLPNLVLSAWPLFFGVGIITVQMTLRYMLAAIAALGPMPANETAIMLVAQKRGSSLVWMAAVVFAVNGGWLGLLIPTFAMVMSFAMAAALIGLMCVLTLIPALLSVSRAAPIMPPLSWIIPLHDRLFGNVLWYGLRRIFTFAAVIAITALIWLVPHLKTSNQVEIADQPVNVLASSADDARVVVKYLNSIPEALSVRWLGAFLPQEAGPKQTILAGLNGQFPRIGPLPSPAPDDLRNAISTLQDSLSEIAAAPQTRGELREAAHQFRRSLELLSGTSSNIEVIEFENRIFGGFNQLADQADQLATLAPPALETLDKRLKALFLSPENIYRIEVTPTLGQTQAQLARILFAKGFAVAHPAVVAEQHHLDNQRRALIVLGLGMGIGFFVLSLLVGEGAAIAASMATIFSAVPLLSALSNYFDVALSPQTIFAATTVFGVLLVLVATSFLKTPDSNTPVFLHTFEAWMPSLLVVAVFASLPRSTLTPLAMACCTALALLPLVVGLFLRPFTLLFRQISA